MLPLPTTSLRPRKIALIIPMIVCFAILLIVGIQKNLEQPVYFVLLVPVVGLILIWLAYRKVELILDNESLTTKTIFSTKQVLWKEVRASFIRYQHHGKSGSHYWYFDGLNSRLKFSTGFYSRKSLRLVAEAVVEKCKDAAIDDKIKRMAEGHFPWYIF